MHLLLRVASVVNSVGESTLEALGDGLLNGFGNNGSVTAILGVGNTAGARVAGVTSVVNLFMLTMLMIREQRMIRTALGRPSSRP